MKIESYSDCLAELQELNLSMQLDSFDFLNGLKRLKKLTLSPCPASESTDLLVLNNLKYLAVLSLENFGFVTQLSFLKNMNIETLSIKSFDALIDISCIGTLQYLETLTIWYCRELQDLYPLGTVRRLGYVDLRFLKYGQDYSAFNTEKLFITYQTQFGLTGVVK